MIDLKKLQDEVGEWATRNFPEDPPVRSLCVALGVSEEAGELAHAILKRHQGIRGTAEEHVAAARDAIGDIVVYLMHLCHHEGWNLEAIIQEITAHVLKRDWQADPVDGVTESEWKVRP